MTFDDYQRAAFKYALYDDKTYPLFGLMEEVGELMSVEARQRRGDSVYNEEAAKGELGDILWNLSAIASEYGWNLHDIAQSNLIKLEDRKKRGVLKGDGDSR